MKPYIKMLVLASVLLAVGLCLGGCASQQNVGVVDRQKVATDSPKVKQLIDQLGAKRNELAEQLKKDQASLKPEDYQKHVEEAQNQYTKLQEDIQKQVVDGMQAAIDQVAKEKKLDVVLYKNGVAQGGTDITDDVIKKMQ